MQRYVLSDGINYIQITKSRSIEKTSELKLATLFLKEEAEAIKQKATKKTKNFVLVKYNAPTQNNDDKQDLVHSQIENKNNQFENEAEDAIKTPRRDFTKTERATVYNAYEGKCGICGRFVPMDSFTIDHIVPISKGGTYELDNLQLACRCCNAIKQDILPDDLIDKLAEIMEYQAVNKADKKAKKKIKKIMKKMKKEKTK